MQTVTEEERDWYQPVEWRSMWHKAVDAEPWTVEPFVSPGRNVAIFSKAGGGKSLLMLEIAAAMATGREVLGQSPAPLRVLYIDHENLVLRDIIPRLKAMGYTDDDLGLLNKNLVYLSFPEMEALDTEAGGERLMEAVERSRAKHVIIDTISRTIDGGENDNDTWLNLYKHGLKSLKAKGIGTTRLDHTGKDESKGARGGSATGGDVDLEWSMATEGDTLTLKRGKARFEVDELITLRRMSDPLRHELIGQLTLEAAPTSVSLKEKVSRFLEENSPSTVTAVKQGVTGKSAAIGHAIQQLIEDGYLQIQDSKRVSIRPYRDISEAEATEPVRANLISVDFTNVKEPPTGTRRERRP